jgi:hypothetical protein
MPRDQHPAESRRSTAPRRAEHESGDTSGPAACTSRRTPAHRVTSAFRRIVACRGVGRRAADRRGQATVELVGLLPLIVTVVFTAAQLLAAGVARELADHAAQAGAMAVLQDTGAPADVARDALPRWARDRAKIDVDGDHVSVTLAPPAPLSAVADALTAHAEADAS